MPALSCWLSCSKAERGEGGKEGRVWWKVVEESKNVRRSQFCYTKVLNHTPFLFFQSQSEPILWIKKKIPAVYGLLSQFFSPHSPWIMRAPCTSSYIHHTLPILTSLCLVLTQSLSFCFSCMLKPFCSQILCRNFTAILNVHRLMFQ